MAITHFSLIHFEGRLTQLSFFSFLTFGLSVSKKVKFLKRKIEELIPGSCRDDQYF